jgi:hypothetical protein
VLCNHFQPWMESQCTAFSIKLLESESCSAGSRRGLEKFQSLYFKKIGKLGDIEKCRKTGILSTLWCHFTDQILQGGISYRSTIYCVVFSGKQFPKNPTYFYDIKFKHTQQTHSSSFNCIVNLTTVQHSSEFRQLQ